jgi:protein tyrosine phosphatase
MSDLSNDTKKHTTKSRETIPLKGTTCASVYSRSPIKKHIKKMPLKREKYVKIYPYCKKGTPGWQFSAIFTPLL